MYVFGTIVDNVITFGNVGEGIVFRGVTDGNTEGFGVFFLDTNDIDGRWSAQIQSPKPLDPDSELTIVEELSGIDSIAPVGIAYGKNNFYVTNSFNLDDRFPAGAIIQLDTSMNFVDLISPEIPATGSIAFDNEYL